MKTKRKTTVATVLFGALFAASSLAQAATHEVLTRVSISVDQEEDSSNGFEPLSSISTYANDHFSGRAEVATALGGVTGEVFANAVGTGSGGASARAYGEVVLEDLQISRLPGYEDLPSTIQIYFDVALNYQRHEAESSDDLWVSYGIGPAGSREFTASTNATLSAGSYRSIANPFSITVGGDLTGSAEGHLEAETCDHEFTIQIHADEVLRLPEGYTVNSPEIVNNVLVPEPGVASLLAGALGILIFIRRRWYRY